MLSEDGLRRQLADSTASMGDNPDRVEQALRRADRIDQHRRRTSLGVLALVVAIATSAATFAVAESAGHGVTPATIAAITCEPGRTITRTPVVASSRFGTVVTITNNTGGSVALRIGQSQRAIVPPGFTEAQVNVGTGRQVVQCINAGTATRAVAVSVVAESHQ
jgi:hypothetical protein